MTDRQKVLLKQISREAVRWDWEKAFGGKSYGNKHLFRVNKIAKFLQEKEGGDEFIILAGAWVHDVALAFGDDYKPSSVGKHTREFLKNFKELRNSEIDKIVECAVGHEGKISKLSLEAQIVHDADVVDKSGMLGVVRHAWKMANMLEKRVLDKTQDLSALEVHLKEREVSVFTKTAREQVSKLNKERDLFFQDGVFAQKVVKLISDKATKGITSDKIATFIVIKFRHPSVNFLEKQLNCEFL